MRPPAGDGGEPELMTPAEVTALLRVDRKTLRRWADSGRLSVTRTPSGHRRYSRREVRALAAARSRSGSAARAGTGPLSAGAVARAFGVEPRTVVRWADEGRIGCTRTAGGHRRSGPAEVAALGADLRRAAPGPLPPWARQLAAAYQGGASVRDCAADLRISYEAARTTLHAMGIIRPRGRRPGQGTNDAGAAL